MQHSGIGGFAKWDGVLNLYHGLITKTVYCAALVYTAAFNKSVLSFTWISVNPSMTAQ